MSAHMDERIPSFETGYKLVMASLATANVMGRDVLRTSVRDDGRMTDHTSHKLPSHTNILPVLDTNVLPPCTHTLPPHTNMVPPHATKVLPVHDANILPPHDTHTLPPHTTNIVPPQAANILPPHDINSVPPHDTIFGPIPLRQRVVTFLLTTYAFGSGGISRRRSGIHTTAYQRLYFC
jgi:hypothetical protein